MSIVRHQFSTHAAPIAFHKTCALSSPPFPRYFGGVGFRRRNLSWGAGVIVCIALQAHAADIGTAFTYQGNLENGSGPVTDTCDFRFGLWDAAAGGNQQGVSPQTKIGVGVTAGVFTVSDLDFGAGAIDGAARWLEIEVQCPPDVGFTLLLPRVELTPAPHAIRASKGVGPPNALEVDTATGKVGIGTDAPFFPLHVSAASISGPAVYGEHTAGSGPTEGGRFASLSTDGRGVFGWATANGGATRGVYGKTSSSDGYAGYFEGGKNYFEGNVGIGTSNPLNMLHVFGDQTLGTGQATGSTEYLQIRGQADSFYIGVLNDPGPTPANTDFFIGQFPGHSQLWIQNDGDVGIRTSSPQGKLHVEGDQVLGTGNATGASEHLRLRAEADSWYLGAINDPGPTPANTAFYIGQFEGHPQLWIENGGDVGLGTSSPDTSLHVGTGSDASLSNGTGYVVLGSVSGANLVIDTNEIIARNNGAAASLFLNNDSGNVGILRGSASHPLHVGIDNTTGNGAHLTAGGTWTNGSSRDFKQGFEPIDKQAVLRKVVELPVTRWQYKGEAVDVHHIGPVAQDFRAAFEVGHDERYITTIDADGVALAAIQGLYEIVQGKDCEINELLERDRGKDHRVGELEQRNAELEARLSRLEVLLFTTSTQGKKP